MKRMFTLQKGVVLLSLVATLVFSALTLAQSEQTLPATDLKTNLRQTADAPNLAQRIERVEKGLLPPAVLKGETPAKMKVAAFTRIATLQ
jgi:hypothetical protein